MIDLLSLQGIIKRYEVYEDGEHEDPVGRYVLASDCASLCSELSAAREERYELMCTINDLAGGSAQGLLYHAKRMKRKQERLESEKAAK